LKNLIIQICRVFSKKILILFSLIASIFIIVFISTSGLLVVDRMKDSNTNVQVKSNKADFISQLDIPKLSLKIDFQKDQKGKIEATSVNNLAQINMDDFFLLLNQKYPNRLTNPESFTPFQDGQGVLFPFKSTEIVSKNKLNPKNYANYLSTPTGLLKKDIAGSLTFGLTPYALGASIFTRENKIGYDFRKIVISDIPANLHDLSKKTTIHENHYYEPFFEGEWVTGIGMSVRPYAMVKRQLNKKEVPKLSLFRKTNEKQIYNNSKFPVLNEKWYSYSDNLKDRLVAHSQDNQITTFLDQLERKEYDETKVKTLISSTTGIPFINTTTRGYKFNLILDKSNMTKLEEKFIQENDIENWILDQSIELTDFQLLENTREEFELSNAETKKITTDLINKKFEKIKNNNLKKLTKKYNDWIEIKYDNLLKQLKLEKQIQNEFFYNDKNNNKFIITNINKTINKEVLVDGQFYGGKLQTSEDFFKIINNTRDENGFITVESIYTYFKLIKENVFGLNINFGTKYFTPEEIIDLNLIYFNEKINDPNFELWMVNTDKKCPLRSYQLTVYPTPIPHNILRFEMIKTFGFSTNWNSIYLPINITNNICNLNYAYIENSNKKLIPDKTIVLSKTKSIYSYDDLLKQLTLTTKPLNLQEYINNLPNEYVFDFYGNKQLIGASVDRADFIYPLVSPLNPIPNPKNSGIVFLNNSTYDSFYNMSKQSDDYYISLRTINHDISTDEILINLLNFNENYFAGNQIIRVNTVDKGLSSLPIISMRYVLPQKIINYLSLFIFCLISVLLLLCLFIIYLLIKLMFQTLNDAITTARANGFSFKKIYGSIALPLLIFSTVFTIIAYLIGYACATSISSVISGLWFVNLGAIIFNPILFIITILILNGFIALFLFIYLQLKLRKPIIEAIQNTSNLKLNFIGKVLRNNKGFLHGIHKLHLSLVLSKWRKLFLITTLTSLIFSIGVWNIDLRNKISSSYKSTKIVNQYNNQIDLVSPNEAAGLYKVQNSSELGITAPELGINSIYKAGENNPYYTLLNNPATKNLMAVREYVNGKYIIPINPQYYTNVILPSYSIYQTINDGISNNLFDSVISTFLLDVQTPFGNIWKEFIEPLFPLKLTYQINKNLNKFRRRLLDDKFLGIDFKKFVTIDKTDPSIVTLNSSVFKIPADVYKARFSDNFLKFIGELIGTNKIWNDDFKLTMGIVPFNESESEKYTYVNSSILAIDDKILKNKLNQKIIGIKDNSKFISLNNANEIDYEYNTNGNLKLKTLLNKNDLNNYSQNNLSSNKYKTFNILINYGACIKYGFEVGTTFTAEIKNNYQSTSQTMVKAIFPTFKIQNPIVNFKVVGITDDNINESFYIDQKVANEISNLVLADTITIKDSKTEFLKIKNNTPFNGIYSKNNKNPLGGSVIPFYSLNGLYSSRFEMDYYTKIFDRIFLANIYSTRNSKVISDFLESKMQSQGLTPTVENTWIYENKLINKMFNNLTDPEMVLFFLTIYNGKQLDISINNIRSIDLINNLYKITDTVTNSLVVILFSLLIPILLLTILISCNAIIEELRRIFMMMVVLGFSRKEILLSNILIYVPVIIGVIIIALILIVILNYISQIFIFNMTTILINKLINPEIFGIGLLILFIFFAGAIGTILAKMKFTNKNEIIKV